MSPIFLDLQTVSIVFALITFSLCLLMMFIWRTNRTYSGFGFWTLANISATIGFLLLALYGVFSDLLIVVIAYTFTFGSLLLCFLGNRKFLGFSSGWLFSSVLLILNALLQLYFSEQPSNRIISSSLLLMIVSGCTAFDFLRSRLKEGNILYSFVCAVYLFFSLLMIIRATLLYTNPDSINWVQPLSEMTFIIFAIGWTFIYMILNNERLQQELKMTKAEFERLATTDFLTGINNNRRFFEVGEIEMQRSRRFHYPLTLIMFDIDYFKKINDTYGHAVGDKVLIAAVDICKFNLREVDTIGRLGGEEFGILLPHTDIDVGKMVAGRLRRAFNETEITISSKTVKITASFGVTAFYETDKELQDLLNRADTALYEAKQNGRNQVKAAPTINQPMPEIFPEIDSTQIM